MWEIFVILVFKDKNVRLLKKLSLAVRHDTFYLDMSTKGIEEQRSRGA